MLTWLKPRLKFMPLPMNIPEFNEWSTRIINQACLPTKNLDTQKFALASMIMESGPDAFMRPDEYYVNRLRKAASDQVALQVISDLKEKRVKEQTKPSDVTLNQTGVTDGKVQPHDT